MRAVVRARCDRLDAAWRHRNQSPKSELGLVIDQADLNQTDRADGSFLELRALCYASTH